MDAGKVGNCLLLVPSVCQRGNVGLEMAGFEFPPDAGRGREKGGSHYTHQSNLDQIIHRRRAPFWAKKNLNERQIFPQSQPWSVPTFIYVALFFGGGGRLSLPAQHISVCLLDSLYRLHHLPAYDSLSL